MKLDAAADATGPAGMLQFPTSWLARDRPPGRTPGGVRRQFRLWHPGPARWQRFVSCSAAATGEPFVGHDRWPASPLAPRRPLEPGHRLCDWSNRRADHSLRCCTPAYRAKPCHAEPRLGRSASGPGDDWVADPNGGYFADREALHGVLPSPGLTACRRAQSHGP